MISRLIHFKYILPAILSLLIISFLFAGCTGAKKISVNSINEVTTKSVNDWSVEDCNLIIALSTVSNKENYLSGSIAYELSGIDVFISAMPMTGMTIKAIAKKEALLKRLSDSEFEVLLKDYFHAYTNYEYIPEKDSLTKKGIPQDSLKGLTFQVVFQNNTDPYRPIILEQGYDYFFLENKDGDYARVVEISGRYAETDFYLTDYLGVNITFNSRSVKDKLLFDNLLNLSEFNLVFNGLDEDPIELEWKLLNNVK